MNQINCFLFPEPSFLSYHETHPTQQHLSGVGCGVGSDWPQEPPFAIRLTAPSSTYLGWGAGWGPTGPRSLHWP